MHPNKFFKIAKVLNCNGMSDQDVRQTLIDAHPLNFLKSEIKLPLYKITIKYKTRRGNLRESEKYLLINVSLGGGKSNKTIQRYMDEYSKFHGLFDTEVIGVQHFCDVALIID